LSIDADVVIFNVNSQFNRDAFAATIRRRVSHSSTSITATVAAADTAPTISFSRPYGLYSVLCSHFLYV